MEKQKFSVHHNKSVEALLRIYEQELRDIRNSYSAPNMSANDLKLTLQTHLNNFQMDLTSIIEFLGNAGKCADCGEIYPLSQQFCEECEQLDVNYEFHYNGPVLP